MEEDAIVMLPSPQVGHLASSIEFAKAILKRRRPSLSIHILLAPVPVSAGSSSSSISSPSPSIQLHHLPTKFVPPDVSFTHRETLIFHVLRHSNPDVRNFLLDLSRRQTIRAFIIDFFCTCASEVAFELAIPTYFYFTSPLGCLCFYAYLSTLHHSNTHSIIDSDTALIEVPGISPLPARDFPIPLQNRTSEAYAFFLEFSEAIPKSSGVLVNTFEALEAESIKAFKSGQCIPTNPTPPLYCTGPLLTTMKNASQRHECLTWLDSQPEKRVIFLSFGSMGVFTKEQTVEIAEGLERSGQRFLWVVRNPQSNEDVESVLPEGFKERTKERGLLVRNWAPQMEVLQHSAIGGFLTHCGWNSVLEAVCAGAAMVTWPLYAEQKMNRAILVGRGIAIALEEDGNRFVRGEEVEKKVREIMEAGESVRRRCDAIRAAALKSLAPGGSSFSDLGDFCEQLFKT